MLARNDGRQGWEKGKMMLKTVALVMFACISCTTLAAAPADDSYVVPRFDRKPNVECQKPLAKFRVVYQVNKQNRGGDYSNEIGADYVCMEKERASTERGLTDLKFYLTSIHNGYQHIIISVTPMTQ